MKKLIFGFVLIVFAAALISHGQNLEQEKAAVTYDVTMKGLTKSLNGSKFHFTTTGTMTWDETSGNVSFNVVTSSGVAFEGAGIMAAGIRESYAATTFNSASATGQAVFTGRFSKDKSKFTGKFQAASPNRLGPAPGGFVFTTGTVKALLQ